MKPKPNRLVAELVEFFEKNEITQQQIAKATGVHQSQVSRILRGQFRSADGNVSKICKYAKVTASGTATKKSASTELLEELNQLLDGTTKREQAVIRLLKVIRNL